MTTTTTATTTASTHAAAVHADDAAERRARASIAFGRRRGYYRVLFESGPVDAAEFAVLAGIPESSAGTWLAEQLAAGILRAVLAPDGRHDELLLPGEYVPILLGDDGESELDGARRLLQEHRDALPHVLRSPPTFADAARAARPL
ncbi:hypothetical protein J2X63_000932 [Agromyces sp. 3263]|uniref:hypothetical protein n=1 Tax=Agromyces sp. 3263 TaxID=2817750 RepID=UPI0028567AB3|nr:hypothetical protein [Agromyces sp. 3263]MDR6905246.1 hypothetical protein [Agromyces sp. 3263]